MNIFDLQNMPLIAENATVGIPGKTDVKTINGKSFVDLWDGREWAEYEVTADGELISSDGGYWYNLLLTPIVEIPQTNG